MAQATTTNGQKSPRQDSGERPARRRITKRKAVEAHLRGYFEALARRDSAAMAGHWALEGVADVVPHGILRGRTEIAAYYARMLAAMPDLETTLERIAATERLAAVEWRMSGHFSGSAFMDLEPTGRRIDIRGTDLFEVEDGEIVSSTAYYDGASFARQVGMLPSEGSGAERAMKGAFNAVTKLRRKVA